MVLIINLTKKRLHLFETHFGLFALLRIDYRNSWVYIKFS